MAIFQEATKYFVASWNIAIYKDPILNENWIFVNGNIPRSYKIFCDLFFVLLKQIVARQIGPNPFVFRRNGLRECTNLFISFSYKP